MKEKTKKILKGAGFTLGAVALLTLGVAVGACSANAGTKQQTAITTPVAKSLIQRPKKAVSDLTGTKWSYEVVENEEGPNPPDRVTLDCLGTITNQNNDSLSFTYIINYDNSILDFYNVSGDYFTFDNLGNGFFNGDDAELGNYIVEFTGGTGCTNSGLISWFESYATQVEEEPTPDPEPTPLPEIKEKVVLNSSYDFRRWFGNVDPTTGAIQFKLPTGISLYSVRVGGLEWENLGNERIYNCIEFTLQPLNASNALAVSDNLAKTAESLYGEKYTDFCMLSGVYYSYQSGYDGTYTIIQDSALPSVDYRDRIYSMPMVSAQLDGTANNVNALDIRNCVIPSIYRSFGIVEDSGVIFSTNGYSSVTLRQLLGMDFSSVVNYSEGTASAFSLLTQAFGSVAGLLAVQVLPNITLGLLLFLPLIAAVIVLIIKAVKK